MLRNQINFSDWQCKEQSEINEPANPQLAVEELRMLVKGDTLLKSRMDDAFLLKFLRARKYNVNKAFKLIQNYYEVKERSPALFDLTGPTKSKVLLESGTIFMLPYRDQQGREIYVFRLKNISPGITIEDVFKMNLMMLEIVSEKHETQLAGMVAIADFTGFEWLKHYQYLSPYYAKKSAEVVQDSFPLRFQGFHFINEPLYLYTIYSIIKPFLKEKIRCRVHFHGNNFNSLHKHLNPNILPKYFNGTLEFNPMTCVDEFLNKQQYFEEMKKYGYNR
ncbi:Cellular retinaldehyde binding/alpha-tocopherol transport,CRAL/TRIO, N-terminal domain,CRAL-TRIO lipid [Cinara cedri]|uniref:Cellular retinaldehyde binding/alpha-tocopherol transport,CRAL/TRIO, N-terminal domain,CRAL-TRIO lipid n=1 Tax=Cinara cedri TaxID=506608 RepID=A0A5E4MG68_9HEMI|nr:Cellular retinaldehyde binding/alpha-tocopherol transport,CRAL/TRIO, N-terminal domain,CRAL-TRIO lipid [Cinara cedri]